MMSDASDMLAAALEQMDGIIAGRVLSQLQKSGVCVLLLPRSLKKLVLSTEGAGCPP